MENHLLDTIREFTWKQIVDWVGDRTASRGEAYDSRVGSVLWTGDCLAAKIRGTETYVTNLLEDGKGGLRSVCSCPVGIDCKHGVALALVASRKLKRGEEIPSTESRELVLDREAIRKSHAKMPPPPPPPPEKNVVRHRIDRNPFDRFSALGGRHDRNFSFRVETEDGVFHWCLLIPTLAYFLARGSLSFRIRDHYRNHADEEIFDPPLFTCSCGDVHCGGFGDQRCSMTADSVLLGVDHEGKTVELSFDRLHFEYWVLRMFWRMRGSSRVRWDPLETVVKRESFDAMVSSLLEVRPRCRILWSFLSQKRKLEETDFADLAAIPPDRGAMPIDSGALREFFVEWHTTRNRGDLRTPGLMWEEREKIKKRMETARLRHEGLFVVLTAVGPHYDSMDIVRGEEVVFVRETSPSREYPAIRVDSVTRGGTLGYIKRREASWVCAMMDRHGLVLKGHAEPLEREGKTLPIRVDVGFRSRADYAFDWGAGLSDGARLHFEMFRTIAQRIQLFSAETIKTYFEGCQWCMSSWESNPEIEFVRAVVRARASLAEARLTEEELAKRRRYCDAVRKAKTCEAAGELLRVGSLDVLPLTVPFADSSLPADEVLDRARSFIRLTWDRETGERPSVRLEAFPPKATGFAVFRGRELLDVCLTGIPLADSDLFDNLALYEQSEPDRPFDSSRMALEAVRDFLDDLPIREPDEKGNPPCFWYERGIHDGVCMMGRGGRLAVLRIIMLSARRKWVD